MRKESIIISCIYFQIFSMSFQFSTMAIGSSATPSSSSSSSSSSPPCDGGGDDQHSIGWTAERLHQASYKDLGSPAQVEERFYQHLLRSSSCSTTRDSLITLLCESSTTTRDYSISIDAFDLLHDDPILGHLLLQYPATLLPLLEILSIIFSYNNCHNDGRIRIWYNRYECYRFTESYSTLITELLSSFLSFSQSSLSMVKRCKCHYQWIHDLI